MTGEQVRELPMNGRNFVQLTTLVPGAAVGESFDNKNKGLFAGVDISFSGAPSVNNQWTVDGAGNNDIGSQRTILVYPSIDGIDEFKIQRNSYGPEFFFFQAEDVIRDGRVTGVQTCALPIPRPCSPAAGRRARPAHRLERGR